MAITGRGSSVQTGRMDLGAIIESGHPPDEDYQDLLEEAFLSYQINSLSYSLALPIIEQFGRTTTDRLIRDPQKPPTAPTTH